MWGVMQDGMKVPWRSPPGFAVHRCLALREVACIEVEAIGIHFTLCSEHLNLSRQSVWGFLVQQHKAPHLAIETSFKFYELPQFPDPFF